MQHASIDFGIALLIEKKANIEPSSEKKWNN